jgi:hypothetical protein
MLDLRLAVLDEDHRLVSELKANLAGVLLDQKRYDEAEVMLLDAKTRLLRDRGPEDIISQDVIGRLILLYEATDRLAEADELRPLFEGNIRDLNPEPGPEPGSESPAADGTQTTQSNPSDPAGQTTQ